MKLRVFKLDSLPKAAVGGTAGPAMAGPLFWPDPFSRPIIFIFYFLPGNFSADQILSNNIDN